jgi:hypothetical protein
VKTTATDGIDRTFPVESALAITLVTLKSKEKWIIS